jgi:regulator of replication initiation timing
MFNNFQNLQININNNINQDILNINKVSLGNINAISTLSGILYNSLIQINNNNSLINNNNNYQRLFNNGISGKIYFQSTVNNTINQNIVNINDVIYTNFNSLSGQLLYNSILINNNNNLVVNNNLIFLSLSSTVLSIRQNINNYINFNNNAILSLSGLITANKINLSLYKISQTLINNNQNSTINNNFDNLQNQINKNKKRSGESSGGNTAGNIVNGIATFGLGVSSALLFSSIFSTLSALQLEMVNTNGYIESLADRISYLIQENRKLKTKVRYLEEDLRKLEFKTEYLDRNKINGDLFVYGVISQLSNMDNQKKNIFTNKTVFYSKVDMKEIAFFFGIPE